MQLEIKEPPDEAPLRITTLAYDHPPLQVDTEQSSLSQIDSATTVALSGPSEPEPDPESSMGVSKRGMDKEKGRKRGRPRRSNEVPTQDQVEFDGQFEIPVPADNQAHCVTPDNEMQPVVNSPPIIVPESPATDTSAEPAPLVVVQASLLNSNTIVPTSDPLTSLSSVSEHPYSRLQTPLIIHRNRSPNLSPSGHTPSTSSAGQQDTKDTSSSRLHLLLASDQDQNSKMTEKKVAQWTSSIENGSISPNVRRSPRKRTPQILKSYALGHSSTRNPSPVAKKTRKQKLTELSPSQNDDTLSSSSSSSQPRRGRRSKCPVSINVKTTGTTEGEKHPIEWSVEDVAEFISNIPRCDYTLVFKEHVSQLFINIVGVIVPRGI